MKSETETRSSYTIDSASLRHGQRHLMYRLNIFSLDEDGRVLSKAGTPIKTVSLIENEVSFINKMLINLSDFRKKNKK